MSVYSLFAAPVSGMLSQSHALNVIGVNVANVTTGGYKATDVRFSTLVSDQFSNNRDMGGVRPNEFQQVEAQGLLLASARDLDVGINGQGFFILNSAIDGSGNTFYGRDGSFQLGLGDTTSAIADDGSTITVREGYLADKNGLFVQGLLPNDDGTFDPNGTLQSLRIDQFAFSNSGEPTTNAELVLNLPAGLDFEETIDFGIDVFDTDGTQQSAFLNFQKGDFTQTPPVLDPNLWTLTATTDTGTSAGQLMTFTQNGLLESPTNATFALTFASGGSATVDFDIDEMTQFDGDFVPFKYDKNGFRASEITRLEFDREGHVIASFDDASTRTIYRVPLAVFANANGLVERNGNVFQEGPESGDRLVVVGGTNGFAEFAPHTREISNVDIGQEFTQMILVQNAYNMSATSFRTIDEMTEVARDLKR